MVLVFYGLMFGSITSIVLPIAVSNGNTCCRSGRHRCALALPAGSRLTAASCSAAHAAASSLTSTTNHTRVMLRLLWRLLVHVWLWDLLQVIMRMMVGAATTWWRRLLM